MTLTALIALNAILDLAVVAAVFAVVWFTHHLHDHDARPESAHPSQPLPVRVVLTRRAADDLAQAA
jgi:hypothetical protein